jgi:biopolymer transport protein ExbD/TolR
VTPRGHHERALDHGKAEIDEAHEINVTPFIDVMLVLLIIFDRSSQSQRRCRMVDGRRGEGPLARIERVAGALRPLRYRFVAEIGPPRG